MNPIFLQTIASRIIKFNKFKSRSNVTRQELDNETRSVLITLKRSIKDTILIITGIFSAAFGLKGFLLPNLFIDGGVTGISLLVTELTPYPLYIFIVIFNIPFLLLGLNQINKTFVIKSIAGIIGLAVVLALIDFPIITADKLLVAVFGGVFLGLGTGFAIRGGSIIDGTEILAIYVDKKTVLTVGETLFIINIIIFSFAAYLLSIESSLYSILTYFSATKTVDFIIEGLEEYTAVTIVSEKHERIREMIIEKLGHGVTIFEGKKGFSGIYGQQNKLEIIYSVITRLEISRLMTEIEKIDSEAFVVTGSIKDTKGGMIKKKPQKINFNKN